MVIYWQLKMHLSEPVIHDTDERAIEAAKKRAEKLSEVVPREKVILQPVGNFEGYGEGRVSYNDTVYSLVMEADIKDPEGDNFYEGWLVRESPFESLSTGKMKKNPDGLYELSFQSKEDLLDHNLVVITLEEVFDDKSEVHVLEGSY